MPPGIITIENEPRQLIVAAALMVATVIIQTVGIIFLEDRIIRWRVRVVADTTRPRVVRKRTDTTRTLGVIDE